LEKAVSVSEFPYPGNASHRPYELATPVAGVSLWWCSLDDDETSLPPLSAWLSAAETARAARFGLPRLARRYVRGRAALRWILAHRLGVAPADVPIERGERGRPRLRGGLRPDFNVSNTRAVAFVGICDAPDMRIGVDVEHEARSLEHAGLARKYLTPREQAALATADDDTHRKSFLRLWTCKEAMSKATGDALAAPLRDLDVELVPALRLAAGPPPYVPADWRLLHADAPAGFLATVALWRRTSQF
jgi:4'-phosphopantetheinyl transferase